MNFSCVIPFAPVALSKSILLYSFLYSSNLSLDKGNKIFFSKSILFNLLFNIVILVVMNRLDTNDKKMIFFHL